MCSHFISSRSIASNLVGSTLAVGNYHQVQAVTLRQVPRRKQDNALTIGTAEQVVLEHCQYGLESPWRHTELAPLNDDYEFRARIAVKPVGHREGN